MKLGKIFLFTLVVLYSCGKDQNSHLPLSGLDEIKTPVIDEGEPQDNSSDDIHGETIPTIQSLRWYPNNIWQKRWSQTVVAKVFELGLDQQEVKFSDLLDLDCPGYSDASSTQRTFFWLTLVASVASQESAFNPRTRYYEYQLGEWSEGLLQLSVSNQWHGEECYDLDRHSILDPEANLKCGIRILKNQLEGSSSRSSNEVFPVRTYYWSTLTAANKKARVIEFFKKHLHDLSFCAGV